MQNPMALFDYLSVYRSIMTVNYYPQDIEFVVQDASEAVRPGCVAVFSSSDDGTDPADGLEIVFEIRKNRDAAEAISLVRRSVADKIGLLPARVVAIKEKTINKTTR
jgi:fatty acid CoA ligase FadD32